jgi:hypothetical protein
MAPAAAAGLDPPIVKKGTPRAMTKKKTTIRL